jgi:O-antigen/teichoic acid export membrane protein
MLQVIKGPSQVAFYAVAYAIFETALSFSWSVTSALLPTLSRTAEPNASAAVFKVAATLLMAIYIPLAITTAFTARWLIEAVYSSRYVAAEGVLAVLAAAALCNAVANLAQTTAIVAGRGREIASIAASLLALNVGMNLFAIPQYGYRGAGVTTLITELVAAGALLSLYVRHNRSVARYTLGVGIALIGVATIGLLSISGALRPVPVTVACGVVLAGVLLAVSELGRDEREAFAYFRGGAKRGRLRCSHTADS